MDIIKENIQIDFTTPKLFNEYFADMSFGVFDIETTGLSSENSNIILTGIITNENKKEPVLHQFFAESLSDEKDVLYETAQIINSLDFIITFNGKSFDIPFMRKRCDKYNIFLKNIYNLDFYVLSKNYSDLPNLLPNMKQKTLEKFMGLSTERYDEIDGGKSVEMYLEYLRSKSSELKKIILLHNHDDIIQLEKLIPIINKIDFTKAIYKTGLPCKNRKGISILEGISCTRSSLYLQGSYFESKDYISFPSAEAPFTAQLTSSDGRFKIEVHLDKEGDFHILDAKKFLKEEQLSLTRSLPNFKSDYLVVNNGKIVNCHEVVTFAKFFVENEFGLN